MWFFVIGQEQNYRKIMKLARKRLYLHSPKIRNKNTK